MYIFIDRRGFNAKYCVLKAICEVVQYQFSSENGVLGDLIHILFTYVFMPLLKNWNELINKIM